jgi:hypothetical protein
MGDDGEEDSILEALISMRLKKLKDGSEKARYVPIVAATAAATAAPTVPTVPSSLLLASSNDHLLISMAQGQLLRNRSASPTTP